MSMRECPFCGRTVPAALTQCPHCREALPPIPRVQGPGHEIGRRYIRRGLLYILLSAAVRYLLGETSPVQVPFNIPPEVTQYLLPFLFLLGIGLVVLGVVRRYVL